LTVAVGLVAAAQRQGEPAAWITAPASCFFPPDVIAQGVDLDALAVVRAADSRARLRAADILARSGGFGLIIVDLSDSPDLPLPLQTRLAGLAQKHATALVFLTRQARKERPGALSQSLEAISKPRTEPGGRGKPTGTERGGSMSRICDRRATQPAVMDRGPGDAQRILKQLLVPWNSSEWHKSTSDFAPCQGARRKEYLRYFDDEQRRQGVKAPATYARNH
jgi:hypothetical protein